MPVTQVSTRQKLPAHAQIRAELLACAKTQRTTRFVQHDGEPLTADQRRVVLRIQRRVYRQYRTALVQLDRHYQTDRLRSLVAVGGVQ